MKMADSDLTQDQPFLLIPPPVELSPFERFWQAWPKHHRKRSKKVPLVRWKREKMDSKIEHVLAVLEIDKKRWAENNNLYVPAPEVWIKARMWDCEIEDIAPKRDKTPHPLTKGIIQKSDVRYEPERQTADNQADWKLASEIRSRHNESQQRKVLQWASKMSGNMQLRQFIAYRYLAKWIREHKKPRNQQENDHE
jgi:hypothetical protein